MSGAFAVGRKSEAPSAKAGPRSAEGALRAFPPYGVEVRVRGRVQGVGFRPTVWRLASELRLDGEVLNDGGGVLIRLRGDQERIDALLYRLEREPPPLARIDRIECSDFDGALSAGFHIAESEAGALHTEISPDAAICRACAVELLTPGERRHRYAFTNCTHCGPRLSIVRGIPYDRRRTTMARFPLCPDCEAEYRDPADRRFHAEPTACPVCGPRLELVRLPDRQPIMGDPIETAARLIADGAIVAVKGLGGYQLACDATNREAVAELRRRKRRDAKPFALMARDLDMVRRFCRISAAEETLLTGAAAPIVLLQPAAPAGLPEMVAPGLAAIGFMLPTTPLHLLLARTVDRPLVMTSGNLSDDPQVTDDAELPERLGGIADVALTHDREIANRVDDSVARVVGGVPRLLRRARGYAPAPVALPPGFEQAPELLAMGGELKAAFCLVKDGKAILSQHQGDLEHPAAFDDYRRNLSLYADLFDHHPAALAADLHPEYLSGKLARASGLRLIGVQHHHAHIAACLAENGRALAAPPVLGIALDGLGWGDDGKLWGGEFLCADYRGYERLARLAPVAMPGGTQAAREPWRNLYAHLARVMDRSELAGRFDGKPLTTIDRMIAGNINSPPASSCGRLFDAVAAALGICFEHQAYEGDAAMRLEALVDPAALHDGSGYPFSLSSTGEEGRGEGAASGKAFAPSPTARCASGPPSPAMRERNFLHLDPAAIWEPLLRDIAASVPGGVVSARFHAGLAQALAETAVRLRQQRGFDTVALSGGCFQNAVLFTETAHRLEHTGFTVLSHAAVPANDGGLALGQAAIAAARLIGGEI